MTRRHWWAVGIGLLAMVLTLLPPLWVRTTGDRVTLGVRPVDPLSLFRGNYVDLRYDADLPDDVEAPVSEGAVFAVFADRRPARLLRVETSRPDLDEGEFCLRGELAGRSVGFPALEQFFVSAGRGREIEQQLSDLVAVLAVTDGCRGVLVALEPRRSPGEG